MTEMHSCNVRNPTALTILPMLEKLALMMLSNPPDSIDEFLEHYLDQRDKFFKTSLGIPFDPLAAGIFARMSTDSTERFDIKEEASASTSLDWNNNLMGSMTLFILRDEIRKHCSTAQQNYFKTLSLLISDVAQYGHLVNLFVMKDNEGVALIGEEETSKLAKNDKEKMMRSVASGFEHADVTFAPGSTRHKLEKRIGRLLKKIHGFMGNGFMNQLLRTGDKKNLFLDIAQNSEESVNTLCSILAETKGNRYTLWHRDNKTFPLNHFPGENEETASSLMSTEKDKQRRWTMPPPEPLFNDFIPNYEKYIRRQVDVMAHWVLGDIMIFDAPFHALLSIIWFFFMVWIGGMIWNNVFPD